jgi:hypothetical protein
MTVELDEAPRPVVVHFAAAHLTNPAAAMGAADGRGAAQSGRDNRTVGSQFQQRHNYLLSLRLEQASLIKFGIRIMHVRTFLMTGGVAIAVGGLLQSAEALAQANVVVMDCSRSDATMTITIDLTARTFSDESSSPNPGGSPDPIVDVARGKITEITDQTVTWTAVPGMGGAKRSYTASLNRYTGIVTYSGLGRNGSIPCRRQQRQF